MKHKAGIAVGERAYTAVREMFPGKSLAEIARIVGCKRQTIHWWKTGCAPESIYLQRLCFLGADIDWILTGRRKNT